MVQTRLIRPGVRSMDIECPNCHHLVKVHTNASHGMALCLYCRAEFEWEENVFNSNIPGVEWPSGMENTPELAR